MRSKQSKGLFGSILEKVDLFGQAPNLTYKGLNACKSQYGGTVSLFVVMAWSLSLIFTVWRYFERTSPETNYNNVFVKDPEGFELNSTSFPFAFGLQDNTTSHFMDDQLYTAEASYRFYTRKTVDGVVIVDKQKIPIELAKCSSMNLDKDYFYNVDLKNMYCFKNLNQPMLITGTFESETWGWIYISFKRCSGASCKSDVEIDAKLKKSFFALNFVNSGIQSTNYDDPIVHFPDSFYTTTSTTYSKTMNINMQDTELFTHSSLAGYSEPDYRKITTVKAFPTDFNSIASSGGTVDTIFTAFIRMDRVKIQINRKYKMIYQFMAEFGGMFNVIGVIAIILTSRISKTHYSVDLLKQVMNSSDAIDLIKSDDNNKLYATSSSAKVYQKINAISQVSNRSQVSRLDKKTDEITDRENIELFKQSSKIGSLADKTNQIMVNNLKKRGMANRNPFTFTPKPRLSVVPKSGQCNKNQLLNSNPAKVDMENVGQNLHNPGSPYSFNMMAASKESQEGLSPMPNRLYHHTEDNKVDDRIIDDHSADKQSPLEPDQAVLESIPERRSLKESISKVSAWQQLLYSIMPKCMKPKSIDRILIATEKQIEHKLDLIRVLEVIFKMERLLKLLLTADQLLLFNMLPWDFNTSERITETPEIKIDMLKDGQAAVRKLQNQETLTLLDAKLLQVLGFLSDVEFT